MPSSAVISVLLSIGLGFAVIILIIKARTLAREARNESESRNAALISTVAMSTLLAWALVSVWAVFAVLDALK